MAIFYLSSSPISRASNHRAVRTAALRHGCQMQDLHYGVSCNGLKEASFVLHSQISLPASAPEWAVERYGTGGVASASERLWNDVERRESEHRKRKISQLAMNYKLALPIELELEANISLVSGFLDATLVARGRVVDWVIREKPTGNPHVLMMSPQRFLGDSGFDERIRDFVGGRSLLLSLREKWAEDLNGVLEKAGFSQRVTHEKQQESSDADSDLLE